MDLTASVKFEAYEADPTDGVFVALLHERYIASQGDSPTDALASLVECVRLHRKYGGLDVLPVTPADVLARFEGEPIPIRA